MLSDRFINCASYSAMLVLLAAFGAGVVRESRARREHQIRMSLPHELTHAVWIQVTPCGDRHDSAGTVRPDAVFAKDEQPRAFAWLAGSSHYRRAAPSLPADCVLGVMSSTDRIEDEHFYCYVSATGELGGNKYGGNKYGRNRPDQLWCTVSPQFRAWMATALAASRQ